MVVSLSSRDFFPPPRFRPLLLKWMFIKSYPDFRETKARQFLKPGSIATVHASRAQSARPLPKFHRPAVFSALYGFLLGIFIASSRDAGTFGQSSSNHLVPAKLVVWLRGVLSGRTGAPKEPGPKPHGHTWSSTGPWLNRLGLGVSHVD